MGGREHCHCALEECDFGLKFVQVSHIGETGQNPASTELPMKELSRAQINGDPGWPEKTKRRNSRYARSQTV